MGASEQTVLWRVAADTEHDPELTRVLSDAGYGVVDATATLDVKEHVPRASPAVLIVETCSLEAAHRALQRWSSVHQRGRIPVLVLSENLPDPETSPAIVFDAVLQRAVDRSILLRTLRAYTRPPEPVEAVVEQTELHQLTQSAVQGYAKRMTSLVREVENLFRTMVTPALHLPGVNGAAIYWHQQTTFELVSFSGQFADSAGLASFYGNDSLLREAFLLREPTLIASSGGIDYRKLLERSGVAGAVLCPVRPLRLETGGLLFVALERMPRDSDVALSRLLAEQIELSFLGAVRGPQHNAIEGRYRVLFEHAPCAVVVADLRGRIQEVNRRGEALFGESAALLRGRPFTEQMTARGQHHAHDSLQELLGGSGQHGGQAWIRRPGGDEREVFFHAAVVGSGVDASILLIASDVTDQSELQAQLVQSQKMQAVGSLAGGVAHDFNNLLTAMFSFAGFVRDELPPDDPRREDIGEVLKAADRAAALTRQLLAFSRKQPVEPHVLDLNELILGLDRMLRRTLGEDVELVTLLDEDLGSVEIDAGMFEQVVLNMAVNARDAMPAGGKLVIQTVNERVGELVGGAEFVCIRITDSGMGMDENVQRALFEPFFTTKEPGKGTGLGLSMCYGIIKQAGGDIRVTSQLGKGSTFEIRLPRVRGPVFRARSSAPPLEHGIRGTILVVDDEPLVRRAAVRGLEKHGFSVLSATGGDEAVECVRRHEGAIDLLLVDVVMPKMNGPRLATLVRALQPDISVLFMTGYASEIIGRHGVVDAKTAILHKPFAEAALVTQVRRVLTRARNPQSRPDVH